MNTITPLMRAIMEALDHDEEGFCHGDVACLVAVKLPGVEAAEFDAALAALCTHELIEQVTVSSPSGRLIGCIYKLTDAGCAALWALQKADAVSASVVGIDTASGPDKGIRVTFANGSVIDCVDTNHAPLTGSAHAVCFNSRDELRAYTAGAANGN